MDAQVGRVDEPTQDEVSKVVTVILKVHPECINRISRSFFTNSPIRILLKDVLLNKLAISSS